MADLDAIINKKPPNTSNNTFTYSKGPSNIHSLINDIDNEYENMIHNQLLNNKNNNKHLYTNVLNPLYSNPFNNTKVEPEPEPEPEREMEDVTIDADIKGLADLIKLADDYPLKPHLRYNINMRSIHNIKPELQLLNNMIGMHSLKNSICDQIIYFVQDLHNHSPNNEDFMHTVIYGPPGTGKTEIAKIMGKIFSNLGILHKGTFKKATRTDFVSGYLGQTSLKTKELIEECLGGVLFIDEAYALGNPEKRDSFAKEAIDTLCEALSDHKKDLMVIIAGYENELKKCFFDFNSGLESRFTWRFKTDDYNANELMQIFKKKIEDSEWSLKDDEVLNISWFEDKMDYFKYYGRDMETLFSKCKIAHSRRVFCRPKKEKTVLTLEDLDKGFGIYIENEEVKNRKSDLGDDIIYSMYI